VNHRNIDLKNPTARKTQIFINHGNLTSLFLKKATHYLTKYF